MVIDAKSSEEITRSVLTQIIVEQESRGGNILPISFLRQLISLLWRFDAVTGTQLS
jgi:polyhydroxyalkanoate synthesis regulator protein